VRQYNETKQKNIRTLITYVQQIVIELRNHFTPLAAVLPFFYRAYQPSM